MEFTRVNSSKNNSGNLALPYYTSTQCYTHEQVIHGIEKNGKEKLSRRAGPQAGDDGSDERGHGDPGRGRVEDGGYEDCGTGGDHNGEQIGFERELWKPVVMQCRFLLRELCF